MDIFDYFVHRRMQDEIDQNRSQTSNIDHVTVRLEARLRVLEQTTEALWTLVKAKTGWTDEELIEQAEAARANHPPGRCPACGRTILTQTGKNCLWCGQRLDNRLPIIGSDQS